MNLEKLSISLLVAVFAGTAPGFAEDVNGDGVEQVLLPIVFTPNEVVRGAHGSEFSGELWAHNASNRDLLLQPTGTCVPEVGCVPNFTAHSLIKWGTLRRNVEAAILLVPVDVSHQVHFSNVMFESTGGAQPLGVGLPVVREGQFLTGPAEFLGVPVDVSSRIALRIYDPRIAAGSKVRVSLLSMDGDVFDSFELSPGDDPYRQQVGGVINAPTRAAILDLAVSHPSILGHERVHIRVEPLTAEMEYWALVSVTDNLTQHITLFHPD